MTREGSLFRRCRCGGTVAEGSCRRNHAHGRKDFRWCFKLDVGAEGGVRRTVSGTYRDRKEALAALDAARRDQATGSLIQRSRSTTEEYMTRWLEEISADVAETTLRQYERYWRRMAPLLGFIRLQAVTREDVRRAYAQLKNKGGLGDGTIHSMHIMFHHALNDAVKDKLIHSNPASETHRSRVRPQTDVLSENELPGFYEACARDQHGLYYICCLETGMRRGEGLGLRWRDVSFELGRISVHQEAVEVQHRTASGTTTEVIFKEPKTLSGLRTIALEPETLELLKTHRAKQKKLRTALGLEWTEDDLVFSRADGRVLVPGSMTTAFHTFAQRAGLPRISLHGLRRSFGAHATAGGMPHAILARALGHSRAGFTIATYSPWLPGVDEKSVRRAARQIRLKGRRNR